MPAARIDHRNTGAERVAIAREVRAARRCAFCAERRAALSPTAVSGAHDAATDLRPAIVDAVHRVVTDPGRLSRCFADEVIAQPDAFVPNVGRGLSHRVDELDQELAVQDAAVTRLLARDDGDVRVAAGLLA